MIFMSVNLWSVLVAAVFHDGGGISLVFAPALCPSLDGGHGLRSGRQGQNGRDAEERRQELRHLFRRQPWCRLSFWARSSTITTVNSVLYGMKIGFADLAGLCDHRTAHRQAFRKPVHQAVSDQYRLSVGVLSGDGSDSGSLAAVTQSSVVSRRSSANRAFLHD